MNFLKAYFFQKKTGLFFFQNPLLVFCNVLNFEIIVFHSHKILILLVFNLCELEKKHLEKAFNFLRLQYKISNRIFFNTFTCLLGEKL